ncbi:MAG: M20/M25/M40 family metallo-hydrolase [Acidobacteria bacterium]|nr:M20/M25/M40 family metallo-hydrolase [Acidobacteriota bacterium]
MRKNLFALLLFISLLAPSLALAQAPVRITPAERRIAETITADKLSNWLHFVASDAMAGRDTPSQGLDVTAEFLKMKLSRWGFKPAGDNGTFFQKMVLKRDVIDAAETFVTVNGQKFDYGEDLVRVSGTNTGTMSPKIVFAGNGWMVKSKNLNPYAGIDVSGKIIAVYGEGQISGRNLVPLPAGVTQADLTGERGTDWADVVTYARNNGAAGVMVLASSFLNDNWGAVVQNFGRSRPVVDKLQPAVADQGGARQPTVFIASRKLTNAIFAGEAGNPLAGAASSFEVSKSFSLSIALKPEILQTQNVVALWEGRDAVLKNEMVAVGAHYDHVGTNPNAPGEDKIWNGADDDGSGTVALLAMAEALAVAKVRPKRSVLFVWHAGEEKGLWGAEYFNKFPTVDIKNVIAQLNIDMIGRSRKRDDTNPRNKDLSGPNEVYVIGSEMMSTTLGAITRETNKAFLKLDYNYRYDDPKDTNRFFFRSDHFHYAVNGIPIVFWFTGVHEDYHQPGDHADKIDYAKYEKITRTIFLTMWKLTDLAERPKVDKELPPELRQR